MVKIDILEELSAKRPIIDKIIQRYIPRKYDAKSVEFVFGKPRYAYDVDAATKAIAEPMWDLMDRGGKRWRPALFLLVCEALGGDPEKVFDFVLVPEIVHNGSLIVDDIEDSSDYRRGKPCTYKIFGVDIAVNSGNAMYYLPLISFLKNGNKFDSKTMLRAYEIYSEEMIKIHLGQGMDIYWHKGNADNVTEEQYLQMCAYKTGTLARMSARLAALFAGASEEMIEAVGKFAESIGVAFQIQDDILNLTATSGKAQFTEEYIGSDMTEGKRSLMVIRTLQKASEEDRKRLIEILNMHTKDKKIINEAIDIIKKHSSVEYAKEFARKMMRETWAEVDKLLPPSEAKDKLAAFTEFLVEREI